MRHAKFLGKVLTCITTRNHGVMPGSTWSVESQDMPAHNGEREWGRSFESLEIKEGWLS